MSPWLGPAAGRTPKLLAAGPYYRLHLHPSDVPNIRAAVLAIYGGDDNRINSGIPAIEEAMQANNKIYEKIIDPGADHAFHDDTGPRYDPNSARDTWGWHWPGSNKMCAAPDFATFGLFLRTWNRY